MLTVRSVQINNSTYETLYNFMQNYTASRTKLDPDYIITTTHQPIYTMGPSSSETDILINNAKAPFFKTNRGGKITFHGPGQLIIYTLFDLHRMKIQVHQLIDALEQSTLALLALEKLEGNLDPENRGVYFQKKKIASIGIRVSKGCTYHGIAINVNTDLSYFSAINPCGLENTSMMNISEISNLSIKEIEKQYLNIFLKKLQSITSESIDILPYSDRIL